MIEPTREENLARIKKRIEEIRLDIDRVIKDIAEVADDWPSRAWNEAVKSKDFLGMASISLTQPNLEDLDIFDEITPIIYCFCVPAPIAKAFKVGDVVAYACDEAGKTLASHSCLGEGWAKIDIMDSCHQPKYKARYPEGFELKWVCKPPVNWDNYVSKS